MPKIIGGVDIERVYTSEEIIDMYHAGKLKPIAVEGYVVQANEDGTIKFIPFWESTLWRQEQGTPIQATSPISVDERRAQLEQAHPILRRTPQERVASMAIRIMAEAKRSGVTGLTDAQKKAILGESWIEGEPLSGEDIQRLSAWFMGRAEVDNREADSKRVTRAHMTA